MANSIFNVGDVEGQIDVLSDQIASHFTNTRIAVITSGFTTDFKKFTLDRSYANFHFICIEIGTWGNAEAVIYMPMLRFSEYNTSSHFISCEISVAYQTTRQKVLLYTTDANNIYVKCETSASEVQLKMYGC